MATLKIKTENIYCSFISFGVHYKMRKDKPLSIDLLVIKKNGDARIKNEIRKFFRKYNLMEYKSPEDKLDINTIYKANAYASLYKVYDGGKRKPEEITVSILRDTKPRGLWNYLKEHGAKTENPFPGIYHISGRDILFHTQIIITRELKKENHVWLTSLSNRLNKQDVTRLLQNVRVLRQDFDKELADSVLEVSVQANLPVLTKMKEGDNMCQALMEVMKPEIDKIREEEKKRGIELGEKRGREQGIELGEKRGRELGEKRSIELGEKRGIELGERRGIELGEKRGKIQGLIEAFREMGKDNQEIEKILLQKYSLKKEEILNYL